MRNYCVSTLGLALAFCSVAASGQRAKGPASFCYKRQSHVAALGCLEGRAQTSAAKLDSAESVLRSAVASRDEDQAERDLELAAFDAAAAAFRAYREKQCAFVASLAAGGNGAADRRLLCEIELNHLRTNNLAGEFPHGSNLRLERP